MPATLRTAAHAITTTGVVTVDEADEWLNEVKRAGIPGNQEIQVRISATGRVELFVEQRYEYGPRTSDDLPTDEVPALPVIDEAEDC